MQYTYQIPFQDWLDSIVVMYHGSRLPRRPGNYYICYIYKESIKLNVFQHCKTSLSNSKSVNTEIQWKPLLTKEKTPIICPANQDK